MRSVWLESWFAAAKATPFATTGAIEFPAPSAVLLHRGEQVGEPQPAALNATSMPELVATRTLLAVIAGADGAAPPARFVLDHSFPSSPASSTVTTRVVVIGVEPVTAILPKARAGPDSWVPGRTTDWPRKLPASL